jgi:ribosomal protein L24E
MYIYIRWHSFRNVLYLTLMAPVSQRQKYVKGIMVVQKSEELCYACNSKISILYSKKKENPKVAVTNRSSRVFSTGMIYLKVIILYSVQ